MEGLSSLEEAVEVMRIFQEPLRMTTKRRKGSEPLPTLILAIVFAVFSVGVSMAQNAAPSQQPAPAAQAAPARPTPPTRDPNTPGYVKAKELPDGTVPAADA